MPAEDPDAVEATGSGGTCPRCGAHLPKPDESGLSVCEFCGARLSPREPSPISTASANDPDAPVLRSPPPGTRDAEDEGDDDDGEDDEDGGYDEEGDEEDEGRSPLVYVKLALVLMMLILVFAQMV